MVAAEGEGHGASLRDLFRALKRRTSELLLLSVGVFDIAGVNYGQSVERIEPPRPDVTPGQLERRFADRPWSEASPRPIADSQIVR